MKKTYALIMTAVVMLLLVTSCKTTDPTVTEYYVSYSLYATQAAGEFADPGVPTSLPVGKAFDGWVLTGSTEINTDWTNQPEGYARYNAKLRDLVEVKYYINGILWKTQLKEKFAYPGVPEAKYIPQGLKFNGWVAQGDVEVNKNWKTAPDSLAFHALLERDTITSGINGVDEKLNLQLDKEIKVLGPVSVEETYEVVNGRVKIGGIGYKDLLDAAVAKYPATDQVIDIIVDYKTVELDTDFPAATSPAPKQITFQTAIYTGIAVDIL